VTGARSTPDPEAVSALAEVEAELLRRAPESDVQPTLDPMRALMHLLGDPQSTFPSVHVAGTNGKTSVTRMVERLLLTTGLRTGCFTSPHLVSVTERIALDGQPLAPEQLVAAWDEVAPLLPLVEERGSRPLTYFELVTALAFVAFADAPVSAAAVEVGLGGVWDATNVVDAPVAVVTPIALDHQEWLGPDLATIASQKAGIVKPGAFAVLAAQDPEAEEVLLAHSSDVGATVAREDVDFGVTGRRVAVGGQQVWLRGLAGTYDEVFLPLHGDHQARNAACALAAVEAFLGGQALGDDVVREAFAAATSPGRLELVRRSPTVLVDAAHNPAGARALAEAVGEAFTFASLVGVVGVLDDKDAVGVLEALEPVLSEVVLTRSSSPRAVPPEELARLAEDVFGADRVHTQPDVASALELAVRFAEEPGDLTGAGVLVTGSVTVAGEARELLRRRP
jgi:dihydrofolate synthase/folylpolyglutamate synthase